jgi:hypothetical protein
MADELGVSKAAVYGKLNRLEPSVSQALVRSTAQELATLVRQVGGQQPLLCPKYRQKIVDGNGLEAISIACQCCETTALVLTLGNL